MTVPRSVTDLDPAWLTRLLRGDDVACVVTGVQAERIALDTGFSSELYRLRLEGRGVPRSLIAKLPTTTAVRQVIDAMGGYAREVAFYRDVSAHVPLRAPRTYFASTVDGSSDFLLILEDLGGWDNGDHYAGLPAERMEQCIEQLAGLHAWSADPARSGDVPRRFPTMDSPLLRETFPLLFSEGWEVYRSTAREPIPPGVAGHAAAFPERVAPALDALTERDTLIHGDIRADNIFFSGDQIAIVDYQLIARASGLVDIGYLVSQGMTREVRAGRDERFVRQYLDALQRHGADGPSFEEAWRDYRFAVSFLLLYPVIAIRGWDQLPGRARELCLRLIERSIAAIEECDAVAVYR